MTAILQNRGKKMLQGSFLRTVTVFLQIAISFFMLPFLIHNFGDKLYGLWVLVMIFVDYYTLLRLGFSGAVGRYLSRAVGIEDIEEMSIVSSTSFFIYIIISILMLIATFILYLCSTSIVKTQENLQLFRYLIIIFGISTALAPPFSVFRAILNTHMQYKIVEYVNIILLVIKNSLILIFVKLGYGLLAVAWIYILCNSGRMIFLYFYKRIKYKNIIISLKYFRKNRIKTLFTYSLYTFIAQIAEKLRFKVDTIIITLYIGLIAVTHYNIALSLIGYFMLFIKTIISVFQNYVSQQEGLGDYESIRNRFLLITKINTYLSMFVGFSIIFYGKSFIEKWMGSNYLDAYPILVILTLSAIINLAQHSSVIVLYGISKNKFYAYSNFIEGLLNIAISLMLVKKYGLVGIALGTTIPMLFFSLIIQPIYVNTVLKNSVKKYFFSMMRNFGLPSLILGVFFLFANKYLVASYTTIATLAILQIIYFVILIYFLGFKKDEKKYFQLLWAEIISC